MWINKTLRLGVTAVVLALSLLGLMSIVSPATTAANRVSAQAADGLFTQIYRQVSPSVVSINVVVTGRGGRVTGSGTGSGFVIDNEGHIVTNNHVVSGASSIEVEFYNGMLAAAEIVGLDPASDIAVLQVNVPAEQIVPISFGDSSSLEVGETVLAIGSPYGEDWTLTSGIVSGLNRVINGLTDFAIGAVIQTDAAINPGNSGGPLLNLDGQVVGVNSQIATESGSNSGIGFAVPSNLVQRVVQELIADGTVDYSYLGLVGTDVTLSLIGSLNLPATTRGVIVTDVVNGSPIQQAGLQTGQTDSRFDVITAVENVPILGMSDLISFLARETVPGQTVNLTVLRNGAEMLTLPVTLTTRP